MGTVCLFLSPNDVSFSDPLMRHFLFVANQVMHLQDANIFTDNSFLASFMHIFLNFSTSGEQMASRQCAGARESLCCSGTCLLDH